MTLNIVVVTGNSGPGQHGQQRAAWRWYLFNRQFADAQRQHNNQQSPVAGQGMADQTGIDGGKGGDAAAAPSTSVAER